MYGLGTIGLPYRSLAESGGLRRKGYIVYPLKRSPILLYASGNRKSKWILRLEPSTASISLLQITSFHGAVHV